MNTFLLPNCVREACDHPNPFPVQWDTIGYNVPRDLANYML